MPLISSLKKMSNVSFGKVCYLILIFIELLLKIVYFLIKTLYSIIFYVLTTSAGTTMTESSQKRKRNSIDKHNQQTVLNRNIIDANWNKLLSSNLLADKKMEKPATEDKKDHFTGTFRRARKKKAKSNEISNTVQNDMKTLNISTVTNNLAPNDTSKPNLDIDINGKVPHSQVYNNNLKSSQSVHVPKNSQAKNKLTKFLAMDCEMVGVGYNGDDHMLARVSIVNKFGDCIYDKFVKPREEVKDYRTSISGVRKEDLLNGEDFAKVQKDVAELIKGRILVGHSLKNDMAVLFLSHPKRNIRDTSRYKPFRMITKGSTPSLKRLAKEILGIDIQHGEHSSVEDARAAMQLYCTVAKKWEASLCGKRGYSQKAVEE